VPSSSSKTMGSAVACNALKSTRGNERMAVLVCKKKKKKKKKKNGRKEKETTTIRQHTTTTKLPLTHT
jgi:hypothetical protein